MMVRHIHFQTQLFFLLRFLIELLDLPCFPTEALEIYRQALQPIATNLSSVRLLGKISFLY